jgi:hypothetical protein
MPGSDSVTIIGLPLAAQAQLVNLTQCVRLCL